MSFDYYHPAYRQARADAFSRAGGLCQFCGKDPATHAAHVAFDYPPAAETQPGDLTALCYTCQQMQRHFRDFLKEGGTKYEFASDFAEFRRQRRGGRGVNPDRGGQLTHEQPPVVRLPKKQPGNMTKGNPIQAPPVIRPQRVKRPTHPKPWEIVNKGA